MSEDDRLRLVASLDTAYTACRDILPDGDGVLECLMLGMVALIEDDKAQQTDPLVISCLDSAIHHLRAAAMDYYVSFK